MGLTEPSVNDIFSAVNNKQQAAKTEMEGDKRSSCEKERLIIIIKKVEEDLKVHRKMWVFMRTQKEKGLMVMQPAQP